MVVPTNETECLSWRSDRCSNIKREQIMTKTKEEQLV